MMSVILAALAFLKIKVTWNKGYGVIISVHGVTNKMFIEVRYTLSGEKVFVGENFCHLANIS